MAIEIVKIPARGSLDSIRVYFEDLEEGKGYVTILCYGSAWTTYFGSMGKDVGIKEFFLLAGSDYLANRLGITIHLKQQPAYKKHLISIINEIKQHIAYRENKTSD